jgi:hypothetical protein
LGIARSLDSDLEGGKHLLQLPLDSFCELVEKRRAAGDDNVCEEVGSDLNVDVVDGFFDSGRESLVLLRSRVARVLYD